MKESEKEKAIRELKEAIRKAKAEGLVLGVAKMYRSKAEYALMLSKEMNYELDTN